MLIYNNTANSPFDDIPSPSRYKSVSKRKRSASNRTKLVKRGGQLRNKVQKSKRVRKSKKRAAKKLSVKNLNFLRKLGLRIKKR